MARSSVRLSLFTLLGAPLLLMAAAAPSTAGIAALADRLLGPGRGAAFDFVLTADREPWSRWNEWTNDSYTVSAAARDKIRIEGTTLSALARGLRHYATDTLQLDNFWFVHGGRLVPPGPLPPPTRTLRGSSIVPLRYNLNTVTFSYSFVWYRWHDWEKLLDWAAWRGVNLQLAWVGYEQIFLDSFRALGLADAEILPFFSGPAFQSWNRFGNIKGSWGGLRGLPMAWIDAQFKLQCRIVARMVELGITPVLPAFPGFVPDALLRLRPNASVTPTPTWADVPSRSGVLFLSPLDSTFAELQRAFILRQAAAFGNVSNFYTLDQFNEMLPPGDAATTLGTVARETFASLTAANPAAVWLMQGWLFYNPPRFWTQDRINAYLGGVADPQGIVILDLYAENEPLWRRTNKFAGRPWIWCQLHDFGGNMNMFGRASAVASGPVEALAASTTLVGVGLTPEAYEGNEVVYDLLLDQAWAPKALELPAYFQAWAALRYAGRDAGQGVPQALLQAWDLLGAHVYDCNDRRIPSAGVGVYQLAPSLHGLVNRTGHFPAPTALHYDPALLRRAWRLMLAAAADQPALWALPAFRLDIVDVTRQVMANAFIDRYEALVAAFNASMAAAAPASRPRAIPSRAVSARGAALLDLLDGLDLVLSAEPHFTLAKWLADARFWAGLTGAYELVAFNARSQVTVWLSESSILNDYAARAWAGLTRSYYRPRWDLFVEGLENATIVGSLDEAALAARIRAFERNWQYGGFSVDSDPAAPPSNLRDTIGRIQVQWPEVFSDHSMVKSDSSRLAALAGLSWRRLPYMWPNKLLAT